MLIVACSKEDLSDTIRLTVNMPTQTRVSMTQEDDLAISLKWEASDVLEFVFVQGETKSKGAVKAVKISTDGRTAEFNIKVPAKISGVFDLYGVYGGGGLSNENPTLAKLPKNSYLATSLASVQQRKDMMLYFASKGLETATQKASANFEYLGSLFSISVKNTSASPLTGLLEAKIKGINNSGNVNWAYNNGGGGGSYDLVNNLFLNQESAGNFISFKAINSTLASGKSITFWGWYPPLPNKNWPELQLELINTNSTSIATSTNSKPERTEATATGKSFYFFAEWNGSTLLFVSPPPS